MRCFTLILLVFLSVGCKKASEGKLLQETYPFNSASKVEVISYAFTQEDTENPDNYKIANGRLAIADEKIIEKIQLNKEQVTELFDILYTDSCKEHLKADCYYPAHRLVFYNNKAKVFAYMEFCLSCIDYRLSANVALPYGFCKAKADSLERLFKSAGITHYSEF